MVEELQNLEKIKLVVWVYEYIGNCHTCEWTWKYYVVKIVIFINIALFNGLLCFLTFSQLSSFQHQFLFLT